ncbi:MAG TPA: histone deacetylase [Mycobacteriales bacterium]|nr:histone deacetylase [Mycobacteriales bacterium]
MSSGQEPTDLVWYAAYGSNMHADRFGCYLAGGIPAGASMVRPHPGCRDRAGPRRAVPVLLPGGIYFATESATWSGGVAFYDPALPGVAAGRAYLVTAGQFSDVAAQEMRRPPGTDLDLGPVLRTGRHRLGPGRYETLLSAGTLDGRPLLTFTAPGRSGDLPANAPSATYLRTLGVGLAEAHGWTAERAAAYLCARPGAAGAWDPPTVAALIASGGA